MASIVLLSSVEKPQITSCVSQFFTTEFLLYGFIRHNFKKHIILISCQFKHLDSAEQLG